MRVKEHKHRNRLVLAVCDNELIGKRFVEGDRQLDLTSNFYKGTEKEEEKILALFKVAYMVNLVGKKSVNLGIKANIIGKNNVILVSGVPHSQCLLE